jgi:hypothetical protein
VIIRYFPYRKAWKNRFGEGYDFDKVAHALIAKPLASSSCAGTHVLYSLAVLRQVDEKYHSLSPATRQLVSDYLSKMSAFVASKQLPDGAVDPAWNYDVLREPWYKQVVETSENRLGRSWPPPAVQLRSRRVLDSYKHDLIGTILCTGHHLEWLPLCPAGEQPSTDFTKKCAVFLWKAFRGADPELLNRHYCPYSHAAAVLRMLTTHGPQRGILQPSKK